VSFFLFIFAVWFISVTFPIWLILGSLYGIFIAVISFFGYVSKSFTYISYDFLEGLLVLFVASPLMAIWDGLKAFFDPVSYAWDFARYDHPFWAFLISFCLTIYYANLIEE
jgi:hypothetical protein